MPSPQSNGNPNYEILSGTKHDTYTTGTLSGTVGTATLIGVATSWLSVEGLSKGSRITIGTTVYTVKSISSDTSITLYEKLSITVTTSAYTIHLDNYIIQLYQIPDSAQNIYFRYQRVPDLLVNDEDIPDLPDKYHYILVTAGLIWAWMTKDKEEATQQEALFNAQVAQMWKRIGNISRNVSFPRCSQDSTILNRRNSPYPSDYGVPFTR